MRHVAGAVGGKVRRVKLTEQNPPPKSKAQEVSLLISYSKDGSDWGELTPLQGTSWGDGIQVISAEALSNAMHGHIGPLLREVGWEVRPKARRVSDEEGLCAMRETCHTWQEGYCRPGGRDRRKSGPPICYEPPLEPGTEAKIKQLFRDVALAWQEGRHVVVVVGQEFSLR